MTSTKADSGKQVKVEVRDISGISGEVNIAAGNIYTSHEGTGLSVEQIKPLFDQIYADIDRRAETRPADKANLKAKVQEIQSTVTEAVKNQKKVDKGFLARRFRNIARMAPDILDVIVETLKNPLGGLGVTLKKIAEKAKAGTA